MGEGLSTETECDRLTDRNQENERSMLGNSLGSFSIQSQRGLSGCGNTRTYRYSLDYLGGLSAGNGGIAGGDAAGVQGHWFAASTHPVLGGMRRDLQSSPSGAWVKVRGQVEGVSGGCQAEEVMEACLGTTAQRTGGLGSEHKDRVRSKSGDPEAAKVVTSVFPAGKGCAG